jgi:cob(I)alamin adenosyltransferase
VRIYTRTGDEGQTGLLYGGRVWKDDVGPEAYGAVDEAVSALGVARAVAAGQLAAVLLSLQRDLFVVGAELATDPDNRGKLEPGISRTTDEMVGRLEALIDATVADHPLPQEFVVPGENQLEAALEVARATVRRAERRVISYVRAGGLDQSVVPVYLNRLADLIFVLARATAATWEPTRPKEES